MKIALVKVKREMVTETVCELMDDHNEKITDNKIEEGNNKIPNARNYNYESTTIKRKVNDPYSTLEITLTGN